MRNCWVYPAGADMALRMKVGVVKLSGFKHEQFVHDDGGLHVIAMTQNDIQLNIWAGNLGSVQTVQLGWSFFQEIEQASGTRLDLMEKLGYFTRKEVKIKEV